VIFCSALTADYLAKAAPFLVSLRRLRADRKYVVSVGFSMPSAQGKYEAVSMAATGQPCNQQGQVLDVLPAVDEGEVLVMMDADALVQRDLLPAERTLLAGLTEWEIALGPNRLEPETGAEEFELLQARYPLPHVAGLLGTRLQNVPVYNCGFVAALPWVWRRLRRTYEELLGRAGECFGNWRACQLLLCMAIQQLELKVVELPRTIHAHQHFGRHPDDQVRDGRLFVKDQLAFYAHHIPELGLVGL